MTKTLKTIITSISLLLISSLVNVKESKAEEVKKANSNSSVSKEQNKQIPTEYKSELVNKIIKKYKLDPKNNPKDQCILVDAISAFFELVESSEEEKQHFNEVIKAQKEMGISAIKKSCNKNDDCSINNDVVMKKFGMVQDEAVKLFFDKYGNPIGYFYDVIGNESSIEYKTEMYSREYFYSINEQYGQTLLDYVNKNHSSIDLITKGCYITYLSKKLLPSN